MKRAEAVEELKRVYAVLNDDFSKAQGAVISDPTEFNKRTLIRTTFSLLEGLSYQLRQVTLATLKETSLLSEGDLAILRESRYQLNTKGEPEVKENFQRTLPMILFSLRVYAKNHGATFKPKTDENGWRCLQQAVSTRDRLMHPKSLGDLQIPDDVGNVFAEGIRWWNKSILELFQACDEADRLYATSQAE